MSPCQHMTASVQIFQNIRPLQLVVAMQAQTGLSEATKIAAVQLSYLPLLLLFDVQIAITVVRSKSQCSMHCPLVTQGCNFARQKYRYKLETGSLQGRALLSNTRPDAVLPSWHILSQGTKLLSHMLFWSSHAPQTSLHLRIAVCMMWINTLSRGCSQMG